MALTLPSDIDFVKNKSADPARMNVAMLSLHARLVALELPAKTIDDVLATIQQVGLERVNNALQPYYQQLAAVVSQYETLTQSQTISGGTLDAPVTRIANRRSTTAGDVPTDLVPGEIGINQADGLVFWKDALGVIQSTPLLDVITASILTPMLAAKAPLASPALTGAPTAPTVTAGDISTKIANTSFVNTAVQAAISALLNGAPVALDTLKELADALGDDSNYAATTATALGLRLRVDAAQGLSALQKHVARLNAAAAPWEGLAYQNMAINPRHAFSQFYNAGIGTSIMATGYVDDGHMVSFVGPSMSSKVVTNSPFNSRPDLTNALYTTNTAAFASPASSSFLCVQQNIEGNRMSRLLFGTANASKVFIGVTVRTSVAGIYYVCLRNGVGNRTCLQKVTLAANADTFIPLIFPGDTAGTWANDSSSGLQVIFCLMAGSSLMSPTSSAGAWQAGNSLACTDQVNWCAASGATFYLSDLIVLPCASSITDPSQFIPTDRLPLFQRNYDDEVRLCQRYYQPIWFNFCFPTTATTSANATVGFPVLMRTSPSVTGPAGTTANWSYSISATNISMTVYGTTYAGNAYLYGTYYMDARL